MGTLTAVSGLYTYAGVSYDWFVTMAAFDLDVASLKQLANNSLTYAGWVDPSEQERAFKAWNNEWDSFITWALGYFQSL